MILDVAVELLGQAARLAESWCAAQESRPSRSAARRSGSNVFSYTVVRARLSSAIVSHEMRPVALSHPHARLASCYAACSLSLPLFWQPLSFLGGKEQRRADGAQEKDADAPLSPCSRHCP